MDKWQKTISARERRVLLTKWAGEAWQDPNENYPTLRRKFFEKTGCMMEVMDLFIHKALMTTHFEQLYCL